VLAGEVAAELPEALAALRGPGLGSSDRRSRDLGSTDLRSIDLRSIDRRSIGLGFLPGAGLALPFP
jgi:hypothetical protein